MTNPAEGRLTSISDPIVQALVMARIDLLFNDPWYGNLATRSQLLYDDDQDSLTVTYRHLLFRSGYVASVTPDELRDTIRAAIDERARTTVDVPANPEEAKRQTEFKAAMINAHQTAPTRTPDHIRAFLPDLLSG
jgi:hypothetical protein